MSLNPVGQAVTEEMRKDYDQALLGTGICYGFAQALAEQGDYRPTEITMKRARYLQASYQTAVVGYDDWAFFDVQTLGIRILSQPKKYRSILAQATSLLNYQNLVELLAAYQEARSPVIPSLVGKVALNFPKKVNGVHDKIAALNSTYERSDFDTKIAINDEITTLTSIFMKLHREQSALALLLNFDAYNKALSVEEATSICKAAPMTELASTLCSLKGIPGQFRLDLSGPLDAHVIYVRIESPAFCDVNDFHPLTNLPIFREFKTLQEMSACLASFAEGYNRYTSFTVQKF